MMSNYFTSFTLLQYLVSRVLRSRSAKLDGLSESASILLSRVLIRDLKKDKSHKTNIFTQQRYFL